MKMMAPAAERTTVGKGAQNQQNQQVRQLSYQGYPFDYRILPCPAPVTDPIIVISGAFQDLSSYRRFDRFWSGSATIVGVDLPGTESSAPVPPECGYDLETGALSHLLDELGMARVNLLGISNGYAPAYRLAQQQPSRVAHLVLTGSTARWSPLVISEMYRWIAAFEEGRDEDFARSAIRTFMCGDPALPVRNREPLKRALLQKLGTLTPEQRIRYASATRRAVKHPLVQQMGIADVPTLCLTGEHDTLTPPGEVRALATGIDPVTFSLIRETDHLCFQERAADWSETVLRFFTDRPLTGLDFLTGLEHPSAPAI
jgi:pimeloyl-ACP methyl ester carboxylesterase